jgi:hypothetical protein
MKKLQGSDFLSVADILGMYAVLMRRYGGQSGLRDPGFGHGGLSVDDRILPRRD